MDKAPAGEALPPSLRLLKWLVLILTATMIVGVITVVGLLVTRMPDLRSLGAAPTGGAGSAPAALTDALPAGLTLPAGATVAAVTLTPDAILVVTDDGRLLVYGRDGRMRQEVALTPAP